MALFKKGNNSLINMDRNIDDENYRYKMEKVLIAKEGKNKGKKTVIINVLSLIKGILGTNITVSADNGYNKEVINKTAKHISQFIGKKFGSKCQYKASRGAILISGEQLQSNIQNVIFEYVEKYTFCPYCNLPELQPAVLSVIMCRSCGYNKDQNNKNKKKKKRDKKKKKKKQQSKKVKEDANENDVGDIDEMKEDSDDNIQNRMAKDPIFSLSCYVKKDNVSLDEIKEKIKVLTLAHGLKRNEEIKMIIQALIDYDNDYQAMIESIKNYKQIFEMYTIQNEDVKIFLAVMEQLILCKANLLNHSYAILNCLYDEDIFDEEEILEWYKSNNGMVSDNEAQLIRDKALPFIEWLKNDDDNDNEL